jgi:hypothetical protein
MDQHEGSVEWNAPGLIVRMEGGIDHNFAHRTDDVNSNVMHKGRENEKMTDTQFNRCAGIGRG